jgi:hypothetical protein
MRNTSLSKQTSITILIISILGLVSFLGCGEKKAPYVSITPSDQPEEIYPPDITVESPEPSLSQQYAPSSLDKWEIWTSGTQLRGANIWQRIVIPDLDGLEFLGSEYVGPPYTQEDFNRLAASGANYVNISGPGLYTEEPPYQLDERVEEHLDQLLNMIQKADMFAVITFRTGPGRSDFTFYRDGAGDWFDPDLLREWIWEDQEAQIAWVEMWKHTAARYRDHPIVVGYDLMCEPNAAGIRGIWEPEEFFSVYAGTSLDWNQLFPKIVRGIRAVDPETPILVGGMGWSSVRWLPFLEPTGDSRTVYIAHQYEPQESYTHQENPYPKNSYPGEFDLDWDGKPDSFNQEWLDEYLLVIDEYRRKWDVPVAVNEYGIVRWVPGGAAFLDDQLALFEERGLNHAIWMWDPSWKPWTEEVNAMNYRFGPDPRNHADQLPNPLMDTLQKYWGRNIIRPSDFGPK